MTKKLGGQVWNLPLQIAPRFAGRCNIPDFINISAVNLGRFEGLTKLRNLIKIYAKKRMKAFIKYFLPFSILLSLE
jgi:hypothetical protein